MAISSVDFTHPGGDFTAEMFPGDTLSSNLSEWITSAEAKTDDEDQQTAWVNHLGWRAYANRLIRTPEEVEVEGEGRQQYAWKEQMAWAERRAQHYLDEYLALRDESSTKREYGIVRSRR